MKLRSLFPTLFLAAVTVCGTERDALREKAEKGDAEAMFLLGNSYLQPLRKENRSNPLLASYWYRKAAESGSKEGMFRYAACLERGIGMERDLHAAYEWYRKAADLGFKPARLSRIELDILGIPADPERKKPARVPLPEYGLYELKLLAEEEFLPAELSYVRRMLALRNENSLKEAFRILSRICARRNPPPEAMRMLADCYYSGLGTARNDEAMLSWLRKAAKCGDPEALAKLAYCHEYGRGVAVNKEKAVNLYHFAARLNHPAAQLKYAEHLQYEKKDLDGAMKWYKQAAALKYPRAVYLSGMFALEGIGEKKSEDIAAQRFFEAAQLGDPDAQYQLGNFFASGRGGLRKDDDTSAFWYAQAAGRGHAGAQYEIAKRYLEGGKGLPRSLSKGEIWLRKAVESGYEPAIRLLNSKSFQ